MAAKLARVRDAMKRLNDRHFKWVVEAALEHFVKDVERIEATILRYERFPDLPIFTRYGKARDSILEPDKRAREVGDFARHWPSTMRSSSSCRP